MAAQYSVRGPAGATAAGHSTSSLAHLPPVAQINIAAQPATPALQALLWDLIPPTSLFRSRWDLFMLLLLAYVCITAPYISCFEVELPLDSGLGVWEMCVNAFFLLDIALNFRTGYYGGWRCSGMRAWQGRAASCAAPWRPACLPVCMAHLLNDTYMMCVGCAPGCWPAAPCALAG